MSETLAAPLGHCRLSLQSLEDIEAFEEATMGPVYIAGTMLAATVLGFEGAVSSNMPRSVAFPAETRRGNAVVVL